MTRAVPIVLGIAMVWLAALPPARTAAAAPKPVLGGGFIQLDKNVLQNLKAKDWQAVVGEMKELGLTTLIVQYLGVAADDGATPPEFLFKAVGTDDPIPVILTAAREHKMTVFLGLVRPPVVGNDPTNAKPGYWKKENLGTFAAANVAFAKTVHANYPAADYPAFAGWYVPLENWVGCYPGEGAQKAEEFPDAWTKFYKAVAAGCKTHDATRKVAMSPCLPGWPLRRDYDGKIPNAEFPTIAAQTFAEVVRDTGIDIVMVQDSIGERTLEAEPKNDPAYPGKLTPDVVKRYLKELKTAFAEPGFEVKAELWANVESFEQFEPEKRRACKPTRLRAQLGATADAVTTRVTFDFLHYMSTKVSVGGDAEARKALNAGYRDYLRE